MVGFQFTGSFRIPSPKKFENEIVGQRDGIFLYLRLAFCVPPPESVQLVTFLIGDSVSHREKNISPKRGDWIPSEVPNLSGGGIPPGRAPGPSRACGAPTPRPWCPPSRRPAPHSMDDNARDSEHWNEASPRLTEKPKDLVLRKKRQEWAQMGPKKKEKNTIL